jgi:hypothetical protein
MPNMANEDGTAERMGAMLGIATLTPTYVGVLFFSCAASRISNHIAFKMPNAQASPKPSIQEKYHMIVLS